MCTIGRCVTGFKGRIFASLSWVHLWWPVLAIPCYQKKLHIELAWIFRERLPGSHQTSGVENWKPSKNWVWPMIPNNPEKPKVISVHFWLELHFLGHSMPRMCNVSGLGNGLRPISGWISTHGCHPKSPRRPYGFYGRQHLYSLWNVPQPGRTGTAGKPCSELPV